MMTRIRQTLGEVICDHCQIHIAIPEQSGLKDLSSSLKIEWMDSREAALFLKISIASLRNLGSNGQIPFYKFGRRNRYIKNELESLLLKEKRGLHGN